jgi:exopolysaccharide biosynthesis polyprenyl glycosylphosphotransferase
MPQWLMPSKDLMAPGIDKQPADGDAATDEPTRLALASSPDASSRHGGHRHVPPAHPVPERAVVPLAAGLAAALLAREPFEALVLTLLAFTCAAFVIPDRASWTALLPLMRAPLIVVIPALGTGALVAVDTVTGLPGLGLAGTAVVAGTAGLGALVSYSSVRGHRRQAPQRTAIIGSLRSAVDLARELQLMGIPDYRVVGRIAVAEVPTEVTEHVPTLGALGGLADVIERHEIDLIVMTSEAPRFRVFEELSTTCLHLPVRLWELSSFYEEVFGHVPVAEINAAWFQYIMHPKYRAVGPVSKRTVDLLVSLVAGLLALPLLGLFALLIRRDGGPVLFKQVRIGEGGRPLTLYKLRTMSTSEPDAVWAAPDDPRVTAVGRILRKTHLDELPQLLNVLRGEMSLVGPRPEQPEFVARLEEVLPFYQRRHLLKPGLTGWAQVRCGYAGSDVGSAWKLSHDLYYLKHRSMAFDLAILGETMRTLIADRRYSIEPKWVPFIHGYDPLPPPPDTLPTAFADPLIVIERELPDAASG